MRVIPFSRLTTAVLVPSICRLHVGVVHYKCYCVSVLGPLQIRFLPGLREGKETLMMGATSKNIGVPSWVRASGKGGDMRKSMV